jgi:hypothetical protein
MEYYELAASFLTTILRIDYKKSLIKVWAFASGSDPGTGTDRHRFPRIALQAKTVCHK